MSDENLTVGVDPLPLVGPVRVLRLLDVAALSTMPIVRPAKPALSLITLRLESFARVHSMHPTLVRRERAVSIRYEKFMKIY